MVRPMPVNEGCVKPSETGFGVQLPSAAVRDKLGAGGPSPLMADTEVCASTRPVKAATVAAKPPKRMLCRTQEYNGAIGSYKEGLR